MSEHQINQSEQKFHKKLCLVPSMCKGAKNSFRGYPTERAGSTQNPNKNYQNSKYTNQNENFSLKNYVSYLNSIKEPKIRLRATRRNLQAQPKILKKITGISQNKYVSYLKSVNEPKIHSGADEICPGSLKNNRTQVKFRKP
jgi:hypothetical protein